MEQLSNIKFPIFKIGMYYNIETTGLGRVYIETPFKKYLLDDRSVNEATLAKRRLISESKHPLYSFKKTIFNLRDLIKEKSNTIFIDSYGNMFTYKKGTKRYNIVSKRIKRMEILNPTSIIMHTEYPPFSHLLPNTKDNREAKYISYLISKDGPIIYDITREYHETYKRCL